MLKLQFRDKSRPDMWLVDSLITIGRDASNDIVISSDKVAAEHAELRINDNQIEFFHKAPSKSSFVNGALIALNIPLKAWDVIKIGDTELELIDPLLNRSPRKQQAAQKTQVRDSLSDWLLQAQTAPFSGQLFPVNKVLTIGRDTQCDIAIPMPHISRRHAQVLHENNKLMIKDLGSSNGTYVNGQKKTETQLKNGDEIRVDEFCFKVIYTGESNESEQAEFHTSIREAPVAPEPLPKTTNKYPTPKAIDRDAVESVLEQAYFHGKSKHIRGKVYEVSSSGSAIGRMLGHHLSRDDSSVSARHVEIFKNGRFWSIKNNGAANGLLVNGRMTTRATLVDGDEVTIGGMELVFQCDGQPPRTIQFDDESEGMSFGKIAAWVGGIGVIIIILLSIFSL